MFYRLHYFEPPAVSEPDWRLTELGHIIVDSQAMLKNRTEDDIRAMLAFMNDIMKAGWLDDFNELTIGQQPGESRHIPGPAQTIWSRTNKIDFSRSGAPPDTHSSEFFAAMALSVCGQCFELDSSAREPYSSKIPLDPPIVTPVPECVVQAAEALQTAKVLRDTDSKTAALRAKEVIRRHYRANQDKANEPKNQVHARFRDFYVQNRKRFSTKIKVARHFYDELCTEADRRLLIAVSTNHPNARQNATESLRDGISDLPRPSVN